MAENVPPPPPNVQFPSVQQTTAYAPPPPPAQPAYWQAPPPRRPSFIRRFFVTLFVLVIIVSFLLNLYLLAIVGAQVEGRFSKTEITGTRPDQIVALYDVSGVIDDRAAQQFNSFCREVGADDNVKAVLLRVNSPGGSVTASDEVYSQVLKLMKSGKKVVVSMGGLAASGGYYISAPADEIIAEPTTITGSIGVIMEWVVLKEGLEKIGVQPMILKSTHSNAWKDELSPFEQPNAMQRAHLKEILDSMQTQFEVAVKDGRGIKLKTRTVTHTTTAPGGDGRTETSSETEPFNGKIYLAREAKSLGLVDDIGYQDKAIDRAKTLAKLDKSAKVIKYERRASFRELVLGASTRLSMGSLPFDSKTLDDLQTPRMLMLWKGQ